MPWCDSTAGASANVLSGHRLAWSRRFEDPIPLPRGRQLVTLQDAGTYITKLPKAEHEAAQWQAAMEALILVAESGGPMFREFFLPRVICDTLRDRKSSYPAWRFSQTGTRRQWRFFFEERRPRPY
jgi:hypothetical protein